MSGHRADVVTVGACGVGIRLTVERMPNPGETVMAHEVGIINGGKAANHAIGCSVLGVPTAIVSAVGTDDFARTVRGTLARYGVSDSGLTTLPGATMVGTVTVDDHAENQIVIGPGVLGEFTARDVEAHRDLVRSASICLGSLEVPVDPVEAAFRLAHSSSAITILNPTPVPRLVELAPLLALTEIVIANEHEAAMIVGSGAEPMDAAVELLRFGCDVAVVTFGSRGSVVVSDSIRQIVPAIEVPSEAVVDTSGAGDAFISAFTVAISLGRSPVEAAENGSRAASLIVRGPGFVEALDQWQSFSVQ